MSIDYYHIKDLDLVAKEEDYIPYVYQAGKGWVGDKDHFLTDRLMGYDDTEPVDSPYRVGSTGVLETVKAISEKEAMKLIERL